MSHQIIAHTVRLDKQSAVGIPLYRRYETTSKPTKPSIIAVAVVVPVIMIAFLILIALTLRRRARNNANLTRDNNTRRRIGSTLRQLFLHGINSSSVNNSDTANNSPNERSNDSNATNRRRRRRDGLRRTESGTSMKTLPEYKTSLDENEMMLYKAQNETTENLEQSIVVEIEDMGTPEMSMVNDEEGSRSIRRSSTDERGNTLNEQEEVTEVEPSPQSATSLSYRNSISSMAINGISALRRSIRRSGSTSADTANNVRTENVVEGNEMERLNDSILPPVDDTPTYESLYPTITIEESPSPTTNVIPQAAASSRPILGTGALRNLFRWNGGGANTAFTPIRSAGIPSNQQRFASTASVLSSTNTNPATEINSYDGSSLSLAPTRSIEQPYRPFTSQRIRGMAFPSNNASSISLLSAMSSREGNNADSLNRPSGSSSRQVHQRNISGPISIRRLQFEPPAAGFTDQQMAFLTSVESLGKYAIPMEEDGGENSMERRALPSFEQIARLEENNNAIERIQRNAPTITSGERFRQKEEEMTHERVGLDGTQTTSLQLPVRPSIEQHDNNEPTI